MTHALLSGFRRIGDRFSTRRRSRIDKNGSSIKISHPSHGCPYLVFSPQASHDLKLERGNKIDVYQRPEEEDYIHIVKSNTGVYKTTPYNENSPCGSTYKLNGNDLGTLLQGLYLYLGQDSLQTELHQEPSISYVFGLVQSIESKPRSTRSRTSSAP